MGPLLLSEDRFGGWGGDDLAQIVAALNPGAPGLGVAAGRACAAGAQPVERAGTQGEAASWAPGLQQALVPHTGGGPGQPPQTLPACSVAQAERACLGTVEGDPAVGDDAARPVSVGGVDFRDHGVAGEQQVLEESGRSVDPAGQHVHQGWGGPDVQEPQSGAGLLTEQLGQGDDAAAVGVEVRW